MLIPTKTHFIKLHLKPNNWLQKYTSAQFITVRNTVFFHFVNSLIQYKRNIYITLLHISCSYSGSQRFDKEFAELLAIE